MKKFTLARLASVTEGELQGDPQTPIENAEIIRDCSTGSITFAETPEYLEPLVASQAAAVVVPRSLAASTAKVFLRPVLVVEDAAIAFAKIVRLFRPPSNRPATRVSDRAEIDQTAQLGPEVIVEAGASIGENVEIGARCRIHSGARLLKGSVVGEDTEIFPNVTVYEYTLIGDRCRLHANCVIGGYGFGYDSTSGQHILSEQLGSVIIGDDVDIGCGTTIDRGTYGPTRIGTGTKIDNQVQIGHNCSIGERNLICAQVGIAGSSTTGNDVILAGQVGIGDHINIGDKVILGAQSGVMADIAPGQVFLGSPATPAKQQMQIVASTHRLPEMRKQLKRLEKTVGGNASNGKAPHNTSSNGKAVIGNGVGNDAVDAKAGNANAAHEPASGGTARGADSDSDKNAA